MENPLFSILIANYNNGSFFKDCYESILAQTYTHWEVIIVDDASTDDSVTVIKNMIGNDARFKLYANLENKGCGYTKRRCVEQATGKLCAFLDPDDAITSEALQVMVVEHEKHPDASVIYSNLYFCDQYLNIQYERKSKIIENSNPYFFDFEGNVSAFLSFKKKLYNKTEGINSYLQRAVDRDLLFILYEIGPCFLLDRAMYKYRIHGNGISTNLNENKAYFWFWVAIIDAAKRRNVNIENLFTEKALLSRREVALQKEIDTYNKSLLFKTLRKLGLFKIL